MTKSDFVDVLVNSNSRMTMRARKTLELIYVEGYSQTEAANVTGVSRQCTSAYVKTFRGYMKNLKD